MTPSDLHSLRQQQVAWSRRTFLGKSAQALGTLALGSLLNPQLLRAAPEADGRWRGFLRAPHFMPRAKRIIHLCMAGGPSHVDLFDPKPVLNRLHGKPFPESFTRGQQLAQLQNTVLLARGSNFGFKRCGLAGHMISDLLPHTQSIADDHPLDAHRADQSRSGARVHEYRLDHQGSAEHGFVATLWPGQRGGKSTRLRGAHVERPGRRSAGSRRASGRPVFYPAVSKACSFRARARPSTMSAIRTASARAPSGR